MKYKLITKSGYTLTGWDEEKYIDEIDPYYVDYLPIPILEKDTGNNHYTLNDYQIPEAIHYIKKYFPDEEIEIIEL